MGESRDSRQVLVEDNETTTFETTPGVEVLNTFDGMGLRQDLMRGIYAYGTSKCAPGVGQKIIVNFLRSL